MKKAEMQQLADVVGSKIKKNKSEAVGKLNALLPVGQKNLPAASRSWVSEMNLVLASAIFEQNEILAWENHRNRG